MCLGWRKPWRSLQICYDSFQWGADSMWECVLESFRWHRGICVGKMWQGHGKMVCQHHQQWITNSWEPFRKALLISCVKGRNGVRYSLRGRPCPRSHRHLAWPAPEGQLQRRAGQGERFPILLNLLFLSGRIGGSKSEIKLSYRK